MNDAPVATNDGGPGFTTDEDTTLTTVDVTSNDTNDDNDDNDDDTPVDPTSATVVTDVSNGVLANNGDGTFTYTPNTNFSGTDTFTYTITDSGGLTSNAATVTINVTSTNDPPVANDDEATVDEGASVATVDLTLNDSDPDGPASLTVNSIGAAANGTVVNNGDGTVTYSHDGSETTADSFNYTVTDSLRSDSGIVTVTIRPVNDAPVVVEPGPQSGTVGLGFSLQIVATDSENHDMSYLAADLPAGLTIDANGQVSGTPAGGSEGSYLVTVDVTDNGSPFETTRVTFAFDVAQSFVADAGGPYTILEGGTLALDASGTTGVPTTWRWDLDGDGQYDDAASKTPTVPWATLVTLGINDDGVYPVRLEIDGGTSRAETTLTVANLAPVLTTTGSASATTGAVYTLDLDAVDPGDDTVTSWTINWGDGSIETIAGDPALATHIYTQAGFTFDILASASDEDGTYLQNELLVPSYDGDTVFRFAPTTGAFVQMFATADNPIEADVGPDGRLYVSGERSNDVLRYDATTGAFIDAFVPADSGGLDGAEGIAFGPDGHLYVSDWQARRVLRFDGTTGAFIDVFATTGLRRPYDLVFGPDSNLYVSDYNSHEILRFNGNTGAAIDVFVASRSGGLFKPEQMAFGPDGNLYVSSFGSDEVLRYRGTTGAFMGIFVPARAAGLGEPTGLAFGPDGHLYVGDHRNDAILRFDGATGAFIDVYVASRTGGLTKPDPMTFLPKQQVTITN